MLPRLTDDGLISPEIGAWGEDKYRLVQNYAKMFATSMKGKWDCRVYIDLFSGAGRSKIRDTNKIISASPLLALDIPNKFDRYIFCEQDEKKVIALQERVKREFSEVDTRFIKGDVNQLADKILSEIPQHGQRFKVLSFCFVDPYKIGNIRFQTIKKLSDRFIDFLILIPTGMDAQRNVSSYVNPTNTTVDNFLGNADWRKDWPTAEKNGEGFGYFIAKYFAKEIAALGYKYGGIDETVLVRSTEKNLPLYHLAFFSRNKLGGKFWTEARKYSNDQLKLL
jgi:three-Cys-motif partner protein